jgi:hypothetical protein
VQKIINKEGKEMIKVSVFYPNEKGKKFDMEYYLDKHVPMVRENVGLLAGMWLLIRD